VNDRQSPRDWQDDADHLLNPRTHPGGGAFGVTGAEASTDLNWWRLLRERTQQRSEGSKNHQWWVLWSLLAGLLALNFTFTVFIVALPKVTGEFHTTTSVLTWTMVGPLLANGLAAPAFGKAGDIIGHRRLYLFGLAGAAVSAILTALSGNVGMLLAARTLDGIQGAATGTASSALINLTFRPHERVKAMGWWSLVGAGGPVLGVSIGSPIIQAFGWRALFWFQLVLLVVALVVVSFILPRRRGTPSELAAAKAAARAEFKTMDWIGSWTLSLGVTALMLGLSFGGSRGWTSPICTASWVVAVGAMIGFVVRIHRAERPLIPPHYFTKRNFVLPMVVRACANFAYFGGFFLSPILMELGYGYSEGRVGAVAIARPIVFSISSPIAGYVAMRVGEKVSAVAGMIFLACSLGTFALLQPSSGTWVVIVALALSGLGMGVAMPSSSAIMAYEVAEKEFGVMSAAQMLAMQLGEVAGIQVMETVQATLQHRRGLNHVATLVMKASQATPPVPSALRPYLHGSGPLLATFTTPMALGALVAAGGVVGAFCFRRIPRRHER
jgi:MFS family permease